MKIATLLLVLLLPVTCELHARSPIKEGSGASLLRLTVRVTADPAGEEGFVYTLTDSSVEVRQGIYPDRWDTLLYRGYIPRSASLMESVRQLQLDTLRDSYTSTRYSDGETLYLDADIGGREKHIVLFNYYHRQVDLAIGIINSCLPASFRFRYYWDGKYQR